jgi:hypothetical protein
VRKPLAGARATYGFLTFAAAISLCLLAQTVTVGPGWKTSVYGIPATHLQGDPLKLGEPLRNFASLKRERKKDVRPIRVEVFRRENDMVVVYLFPLSAEITKKDRTIQFDAHIGRNPESNFTFNIPNHFHTNPNTRKFVSTSQLGIH